MIEKTIIVITDGMTEEEIFAAVNECSAPLVADMRTLVEKLVEQIIKEQYDKQSNTTSISEDNHRPDSIEITTD